MADPGGVRTPPFGPRCRLFNIGPKVAPPFFACRPKMDPSGGSRVCVCVTGVITPPPLGMWMTSHGQCPRGVLVNVQEWGCFSIFLRADDVTRTMSKGGGCL